MNVELVEEQPKIMQSMHEKHYFSKYNMFIKREMKCNTFMRLKKSKNYVDLFGEATQKYKKVIEKNSIRINEIFKNFRV